MASLEELRVERIRKLTLLKEAGMSAYPARTEAGIRVAEALTNFETWSTEAKIITLAGRVLSLRGQGALIFCDLNDGTGKVQALLKTDTLGEGPLTLFNDTVDLGDFIEVTGTLFTTKRGEQTIEVSTWLMLTKALRPLPDKWHGLQDVEEKQRRRYLDILLNPEARDLVEKRAKFWQVARDFFLKRGFLEVDTPVLESIAGGAEARPFITHHNALDQDFYLRIAPELWLKRLIIAGLPKVFEIGRVFRNEGMDAEHLQDYSVLEFYQAFSDYEAGMKIVTELYRELADQVFSTQTFSINDFEVDLSKEWETYNYRDIILEKTAIDINKTDLAEIEAKLKDLGIKYDETGFNITRAMDNLWKYCRKDLAGPGFLIGVPVVMEPLAKRSEQDPNIVERFQVILAGSELGKGFSELNDPLDQAERFAEQVKLREAGDEEAQMNDTDFVEALEYGMPPTCGFGLSERLFAFLADKPIREAQIFPLLRPKEK
ncbi:MAG: lysine--tRNA ligase [Patescibacteria group bacterium]